MSGEPKRLVEVNDRTDIDKVVDKMAELMKKELEENKERKGGRSGWLRPSPMKHVLEVYYHCAKLQVALKDLETLKETKDSARRAIKFREELVMEYAADVANHALMVLDTLGLLGVPFPKKKREEKEEKEAKDERSTIYLDTDGY